MPPRNLAHSAFDDLGLEETVKRLVDDIQSLYVSDTVPWVIGYSGGKDSTTVVQLVWTALAGLQPNLRKKHVYIISTDTLVENPVVAQWVDDTLRIMSSEALAQELPISTHRLTPKIEDRFWVNLLGKGYPAPRPKFRWCTVRLKITPSGDFINDVVKKSGEAIVVLGMRKAESKMRARVMERHEAKRIKEGLTRNANLPNSLIYTPIENWSNDDVWTYLLQTDSPYGYDNQELLHLYKDATKDGECPLVVDTSMPTCGDSRFGCWVCTMVSKDKSMAAMIKNNDEKHWMLPLLNFRDDELATENDRELRDFRRMNGHVQLFHGRPIPGPYLQHVRENWLKKLLAIQKQLQEDERVPETVRQTDIISLDELEEIRKVWVLYKHELEDSLPRIYQEVYDSPYPGKTLDETLIFGKCEMELLDTAAEEDRLHYELVRELIDIERQHRHKQRRAGIFASLEASITRGFYASEQDAVEHAKRFEQTVQDEHNEAENRIETSVASEDEITL